MPDFSVADLDAYRDTRSVIKTLKRLGWGQSDLAQLLELCEPLTRGHMPDDEKCARISELCGALIEELGGDDAV